LELRPSGDSSCQVFAAASNSWCVVPLVEGIDNLQLEYGLDTTGVGSPSTYTASPATPAQWAQVVTVRIHVLARNADQTPYYTDTKTYDLGLNADGTANQLSPGGPYKRHAYSQVTRVNNVGQREEQPLCRAPTTDC
jgi:type IV pilus assembly protein PilW